MDFMYDSLTLNLTARWNQTSIRLRALASAKRPPDHYPVWS